MKLAPIYDWLARDEASKLDALREAIGKWHRIARKEFAHRVATAEEPSGELLEHVADSLGDEAFMLQLTERAMWGSLSVAITSTVEAFLAAICRSGGATLSNRATWGEKRQKVDNLIGSSVDSFSGFATVEHVRKAANCFKHRGGNVDANYAMDYGGKLGEAIEFETWDWPAIIVEVKGFLVSLASRVPG